MFTSYIASSKEGFKVSYDKNSRIRIYVNCALDLAQVPASEIPVSILNRIVSKNWRNYDVNTIP